MKEKATLFNPPRIARAMSRALSLDLNTVIRKMEGDKVQPAVFARNQVVDFLRKSEYDLSPDALSSLEERVAAAQNVFENILPHVEATNRRLDNIMFSQYHRARQLSRNWDADMIFSRDIERMKCFISHVLGDYEITELFQACKHGPGTTLGCSFAGTDLEDKWSYPLTGTLEQVKLFELYLEWDPQFAVALSEFNRLSTSPKYKLVTESRTAGVPKTSKIARLIAVEPTLGMFFQQGFMALIVKRLKPLVDLVSAQTSHHFYAMFGSITQLLSTYDMSSASDTVARSLVRETFPSAWYAGLSLVSCKFTTLPSGKIVQLPMFSTMGNATTFPIETLIFYSALVVLNTQYEHERQVIRPEIGYNYDNISVFGDDCIVPRHLNDRFETLISKCGFIINKTKSFYGLEQFRESCGVDFLAGHNIRSFFLSEPHNGSRKSIEAWLYIVINNVFKKLIYNFGRLIYLYMCRAFLRLMRVMFRTYKIRIKYVPCYFPEDSGIRFIDCRIRDHFVGGIEESPVYTDEHGLSKFESLRFRYRNDAEANHVLRYYTHLRTMSYSHWWVTNEPTVGSVFSKSLLVTRAIHDLILRKSHEHEPRLSVTLSNKKLKVSRAKPRLSVKIDTFVDRTHKRIGSYQQVHSCGMMLL